MHTYKQIGTHKHVQTLTHNNHNNRDLVLLLQQEDNFPLAADRFYLFSLLPTDEVANKHVRTGRQKWVN